MSEQSTRRRILGLGAAALGGAGAMLLGQGQARASHLPTQVSAFSDNFEPAVDASNSDSGPAVGGTSQSGNGIEGNANSNIAAGVHGFNADIGYNAHGVKGVVAPGSHGIGVGGQAVNGIGVSGTSQEYLGVSAGSLHGIAFQAFAPGAQAAIRVFGHARFSTVGSSTVPDGADAVFVPFVFVTDRSHIMAALTSDPNSKAAIQWIERAPGSGFTVHLTMQARRATTFSYFIVQPTFEPGMTI